MIRYNDNNIYVGQIKQLLKEYNLPNCRVYKEGLPLIDGFNYIKDGKIYTYHKDYNEQEGNLIETYSYYDNAFILNLTSNLKVSNLIYDSYTHKYLGKYLRFLKDYYRVNLMSMYNCFCFDSVNNLKTERMSSEDGFVIYSIPVRFLESYTIGINTTTSIEMMTTFVGENGLVDVDYRNYLEEISYIKVAGISLNQPFIYTLLDKENMGTSLPDAYFEAYCKFEDNLRLLIKVPNHLESSIVVCEGDFSNNFSLPFPQVVVDKDFDYVEEGIEYLSKMQLFSSENAEQNGLLADRLMEYLTRNAISPLSEYYDIKKVQQVLIQAGLLDRTMYGTWDENLRVAIYSYISKLGLNSKYYDMISYVDKDVETSFANLVVGGMI